MQQRKQSDIRIDNIFNEDMQILNQELNQDLLGRNSPQHYVPTHQTDIKNNSIDNPPGSGLAALNQQETQDIHNLNKFEYSVQNEDYGPQIYLIGGEQSAIIQS